MEFDDIYLEYSPKIFRMCMGYLNDREHARDITQETFISVWQNLPGFKGEAKISTWIFRIATNHCLRAIEKSKRTETTDLPDDVSLPVPEMVEDKLNQLYAYISELNESDRIIISLVLEGVPQAEIAAIVGISNANIRVRVHRIKEKLSNKFKEHEQLG